MGPPTISFFWKRETPANREKTPFPPSPTEKRRDREKNKKPENRT